MFDFPARGQIAFTAYGVRIAVNVEIAEHTKHRGDDAASSGDVSPLETLLSEIRAYLPPGAHEIALDAPCNGVVHVRCTSDSVAVTDREGITQTFTVRLDALHAIDQAIRAIVAVDAPERIFIHAGVVVIDGQALVLPGKSMAGKSTLVAELIRAGARYSSDEYAVFDCHGLVHPYPRRLSMREAAGRREVSVHELSGDVATTPAPVGVVAMLTYHEGQTWNVAAVDQATGALALLENTVAAQRRSVEALRIAAHIARTARLIQGERGEAVDAVAELFAMMRT